jgi:transposase InsO family protein
LPVILPNGWTSRTSPTSVALRTILLENYYLPSDLEAQIDKFIGHYNHRRYHESLGNLTPADVYLGRGQTIVLERERIKKQTIEERRLLHAQAAT